MAYSGPFPLLVYRSVESEAGKEFRVETYSAPYQLYPTMSENLFSKLLLESIMNTVSYNGHNSFSEIVFNSLLSLKYLLDKFLSCILNPSLLSLLAEG